MAGNGPAPKPDADRRRTNQPTFGWVDLPAEGRPGPAPSLPNAPKWLEEHGGWPVATRQAWKALWETPQATAWDQTGQSLYAWAQLHAAIEISGPQASRVGEKRQHEDRHGLNPAAMLKLRWRIVSAAPVEEPAPASRSRRSASTDRRTRILKVVADGEKGTAT